MSEKKWYHYFITVEGARGGEPEPSEPAARPVGRGKAAGPRTAAQTVAEIAAAITAEPVKTPPAGGAALSFEEIYRAAEIVGPAHGYTICKVAEMLESEHIRALPAEVKRSSILVALEAARVRIEEVIQDAVRRDRALDAFELVQERTFRDLETKKNQENNELQVAIDRFAAEQRAKIQANQEAMARERERLSVWRRAKAAEEKRIGDTVGYFVSENPVSVSGRAGAPPSTPGPRA